MPWKTTFIICGVAIAAVFAGQWLVPQGGLAAIAGFTAGFVSPLFSTSDSANRSLIIAVLCILGCTLFPVPWLVVLAAFCLITMTATEARRNGSFGAIPALNGLLLYLLIPPDARTLPLAAVAVAAGIAGVVLSKSLGLAGSAKRPALSKKGAVSVWLFLFAGLALTTLLADAIGHQKSYWLSFLFIYRALAPSGQVHSAALRFGLGACTGALAAISLELLGVPQTGLVMLGGASAVMAVRMLGGNQALTAMLFTLATLLLTAPTVEFAVFRAEMVAIVVVLAGGLAFLISWSWSLVEKRFRKRGSG